MLLLLFIVVVVCFFASLLPALYPGTIVSMLGAAVNGVVAEFLVTRLKLDPGALVVAVKDGYVLTVQGVFAVYVPLMLLLFIASRKGR